MDEEGAAVAVAMKPPVGTAVAAMMAPPVVAAVVAAVAAAAAADPRCYLRHRHPLRPRRHHCGRRRCWKRLRLLLPQKRIVAAVAGFL